MKPLLRYTIGKVSKTGWDILFESVRLVKKIYDDFDIVICHNKMSDLEIARLEELNIPLLRQDDLPKPFDFVDDDFGKKWNWCWKLVPPRIRPEVHEMWVDNDIVFMDRLKGVDKWLTMNTGLIGTGFNRDYGIFTELLMDKEAYCAGLFGLPPNFDFQSEITKICKGRRLKGFDEQGLVSLIVSNMEDYVVLRQDDLVLLSEQWKSKGIRWYPKGLHFARSNKFETHPSWRSYKIATLP